MTLLIAMIMSVAVRIEALPPLFTDTALVRPACAWTGERLVVGMGERAWRLNRRGAWKIATDINAEGLRERTLWADDDGLHRIRTGASHELVLGHKDLEVYNAVTDTSFTIPGKSFMARRDAGLVVTDEGYILIGGRDEVGKAHAEVTRVSFVRQASGFGWANWAVLGAYLLLMLCIGLLVRDKDYFLASRRMPWWAAGVSIWATLVSAITFMAIPAKAYATDWTYYPIVAMALVAAWPVTRSLIPRLRALRLTTAYEYLEVRFSRPVRLMASGLFIVFMIARMALVLYMPALALSAVTGISLPLLIALMGLVTTAYSAVGGMRAVMWGDVVQGAVLVGGAVWCAVWLWTHTEGGALGAWHMAVEGEKMRLFAWSLDWRSVTVWVALVGGFANSLISMTSDQTVVQRYLTTPTEREARRSVWLNGVMCVGVSILFYVIGTGLWTFYRTHPERMDLGMQTMDTLLPQFIMTSLPAGVAGLMIAAIFAAAMSTVSSNINSVSTAFVIDFRKGRGVLASVACGLIGTVLALVMARASIASLLDYFNTILGLLTSGLGGLFVMGMWMPRVRAREAILGFLVGELAVFAVQAFTDVNLFLFGAIGMAVSVSVAWTASICRR